MPSSTLLTIQSLFSLYGYSLFIILGFIGNTFLVIIFSRQRQNACSIYLFGSAIVNILYLIFNGLFEIFPVNYNDVKPSVFVLCKAIIYIRSTVGQVAKTLLVFACIDRFLISNNRASFRALSTPRRAIYLTFFSVIFWLLMGIHIPILATVFNGQCNAFGIYPTILVIYAIVFTGLLPPIISSLFGYLTYRNIKRMHNRVQPIGNNTMNANVAIRRRDRDLLKIVMAEVFVYIITAGLFPFIRLEIMISQYILPNKSIQYAQAELLTVTIAYVLLFINSAVPFYIYLIASKSFRREFKQLVIIFYRKLRRQTIVPDVSRFNEPMAQQDTRV